MPAEVDPSDVEQRILEQAVRIIGRPGGAVTGWAALRWRGAAYFDGSAADGTLRAVPLLRRSSGRQRRHDADLSSAQLAPSDLDLVRGLPCTTIQRALFDEMRFTPSYREAAVAASMTAAAGLISIDLFREYVARRPAWEGVPLVRKAIAVSTDDARSPQECRLVHCWEIDAGLPRPLLNRPLFDLAGNLLGYPDLLDPEAGVVGEYDGAHHKDGAQHRRDVAREGSFRNVGLEYFTVVGGDLRHRDRVVARMLSTRRRALFLPEGRRKWTLDPPPWWTA